MKTCEKSYPNVKIGFRNSVWNFLNVNVLQQYVAESQELYVVPDIWTCIDLGDKEKML